MTPEEREKILEQGTKYANYHWNVNKNPNEHYNAHDDFIKGALWAMKELAQPEVDGSKELNISYACFSNNAKNVINIEPLDKFTQVSISKSKLPTLISWLKKQL